MVNSIDQIVEKEKEFFKDYNGKDYAIFIRDNSQELNSVIESGRTSPISNRCILLSKNENINLWFSPAGNIPNDPEIIILGQATSIPAMEYQINENVYNKTEHEIRKILINSSYRGVMLSNLGSMLKLLGFSNNKHLSFDLEKEWQNVNTCEVSINHVPVGRLFEGDYNTKIMFSQFCMHCATTYNIDKGIYSTTSAKLSKYLKLYEETYGDMHLRMVEQKFFCSNAKLLITLSDRIFKFLRKKYYDKYPNILWLENKDKNKDLTNNKKIVTWIPHPSPGNLFYNRTSEKRGILSTMVEMNDNGKSININKACLDYPLLKRQASQVVFLKQYFNDEPV